MARRATDYISGALAAAQAVAQGLSARAGLRAFRAAGGHIADRRWFNLVSAFRSESERRTLNVGSSLHAIPTDIVPTQWTGSAKRGFFQQVDVVVRDTITGEVRTRTFTGFGRDLRTPAEVIAEALSHFQAGIGSGDYEEVILGAAYTGTYSVGSVAA